MTSHLQRDLDLIKREILRMGAMAEMALRKAVMAVDERRRDLAEDVIRGDDDVDNQELVVENEVLKVLALHQPVAADLRFLIAVLKVNSDLERVADLAGNIAERAIFLASHPPLPAPRRLHEMVERVREMVRNALESLVKQDAGLARWVCQADPAVDEANRDTFAELVDVMKRDVATIERSTMLMSVARHLERIGDHATNIAEDVIYLVEGEIIRHRRSALEGKVADPAPAVRRGTAQ